MYVIVKTSRCYYGGEGARRGKDNPLEFEDWYDACEFAINDGNPVGFDVYRKDVKRNWKEDVPYEPCIQWYEAREIVKRFTLLEDKITHLQLTHEGV